MWVGLYVKRGAPADLLQSIFKVGSFEEINKEMTEEEMFAEVETDTYLNTLYNIIN